MTCVAGVDGAPGGWAVVIMEAGRSSIRKVAALSHILGSAADFDIIAVDVPIGLLEAYKVGGRACDRAARKLLGIPRASSVFPAPIRPVLGATSWEEGCARSRASGGGRRYSFREMVRRYSFRGMVVLKRNNGMKTVIVCYTIVVFLAIWLLMIAARAEGAAEGAVPTCKPVQIEDKVFSCEAPRGQNCHIGKQAPMKKLLSRWRNGGGTAGTGLCWAKGHDPRFGETPCAIDVGNYPTNPNFNHFERCSKINWDAVDSTPKFLPANPAHLVIGAKAERQEHHSQEFEDYQGPPSLGKEIHWAAPPSYKKFIFHCRHSKELNDIYKLICPVAERAFFYKDE